LKVHGGIQGENRHGGITEKTEPSKKYDVHPNQITKWKNQLLEHGSSAYKKNRQTLSNKKQLLTLQC